MVDHITEEIRAIRHALAELCENDIDRIFGKLQNIAATSGRSYVSLPMRPVSRKPVAKVDGSSERSTVRQP